MKKISFTNIQFSLLLADLWENAIFDTGLLSVLETVTEKLHSAKQRKTVQEEVVTEELLTGLSTNRNRQLITHKQQEQLQNTVVAFYGLSVGGNAVISWLLESRARTILISDPDEISPTNLNRLPFGWKDIGKAKVDIVTERIHEISPFTEVISSKKRDIMKVLGKSDRAPHIIVDAIDDMKSKIELRAYADNKNIPLVSAADVGDNVTLDIERYDTKPKPKMFFNRVPGVEKIDLTKLNEVEKRKLIIKLVAYENHSLEMISSLNEIGKTVSTWPQLGSTAQIAGGVVATTIKKIILGENVRSGRYFLSLDELLLADYNTKENSAERKMMIEKVEKRIRNED